MATKICSKCKQELDLSLFTKDKYNKDGLNSQCIDCRSHLKGIEKEIRIKNRELIKIGRKICCICHKEKDISCFPIRKHNYNKPNGQCSDCISKYHKEYREENAEEIAEKQRIYYIEHIDELKQGSLEYRIANAEYIRESGAYHREQNRKNGIYPWRSEDAKIKRNIYRKQKLEEDFNFKFSCSTRMKIYNRIKTGGGKKDVKTEVLLGCTIDFFKAYLESSWIEGMSWDNYGQYGWHIDHILPCSSFNLRDVEQQKKCFHYTNQQPLWMLDNLRKGRKIA
jgi:hypothetical protein